MHFLVAWDPNDKVAENIELFLLSESYMLVQHEEYEDYDNQ